MQSLLHQWFWNKGLVRITSFIRLWSTMTTTESWPFKGGRLVIRSMESCLKGRVEEEVIGKSGGIVG